MGIEMASGSTLRRDLSAVLYEFAAEEARRWGFIGDRVCPVLPVAEAEASYPVISRAGFLKLHPTRRNEDGSYNRTDGRAGTQTYSCEEFGLEAVLDDRKRRRFLSFFDMEMAESRRLLHNILLDRERRVASLAMDAVAYAGNVTGAAWSVVGTGIIAVLEAGILAISQRSGIPRSMISLIVNELNFRYMNLNTAILNQYAATWAPNQGIRPVRIRPEQMAQVLDIREVIVAGGAYDTTGEGVAPTMAAIWGNTYAHLAVLAGPGESLENAAAWRTMLWTPDSGQIPVVERYREEARRGDVLRVRYDADEVATAEADLLNYLIDTTQ